MTSLKKQTVSGVKWLVGTSFLQKAISVSATVILARILGPAQFGLFALAFVAINALDLFKSMGFDSALIQRKDNIEKAANTAFFIIPSLGVMLYVILYFSAPFIGKFLNNPDIVGVARALGIIFVFTCFGKVPAALMEKNMRFKQISIIEITITSIYAISAVIFAISGLGVWSLVIAYILKNLIQNIMFFVFSKWRPKFEFDLQIAREMFHFGKFLFLIGIVGFLKMSLDNILVGKLLGVTALGLYAIAFNISNFGADYFSGRVYRVIFPAFSKIQTDSYDLRQAFLKTTKLTSIFAMPYCAFLFLLGREFVMLIYGEKWIGAVAVLKVLAIAGLFNTLPVALGPLFTATGNSKVCFWYVFVQVALYFLFILPAARLYGLVGVGIIVAASSFIPLILYLPFTMRLIGLKSKDIYSYIKPGLLVSLSTGLIIMLLKCFLRPSMLDKVNTLFLANFLFLGLVFLVSYVIFLWIIDKRAVREIIEIFIKS